ncbi:hypothetical protein IWQ60_010578 [Tieghemiomyces parasiticus]|uniref:Uncharacterized protein n=1 Tax=Tieghemiomyces parasiticus TaxID=78921 RepID=A0A9W7ZU55_9FUNG|nr:hypothetical protein IWQ60_010578 [Tieghemiomyces parasiticus]
MPTARFAAVYCGLPHFRRGAYYSTPATAAAKSTTAVTTKVIYDGPLARTAKVLKRFSITSLTATFVLAPLIMTIDSGLATEVRTILAASAIATSGMSTGLIHWAMHPYITRLSMLTDAATTSAPTSSPVTPRLPVTPDTVLQVESLDFFGRAKNQYVLIKDIRPSSRVFTVWRVGGQSPLNCLEPAVRSALTRRAAPGTMFFAHETASLSPEMTSVFNLVSGKEASLQGRAEALKQSRS